MSEVKTEFDMEESISLLVQREIERGEEYWPRGLVPWRRCRLCGDETPMKEDDFDNHCNTEHHLQRVQETNAYMAKRKVVIARWQKTHELKRRTKQLGLPQWQWEVEKNLYNYISIESEDDIERTKHYYDEACVALRQHEKSERLSLLELAVWKTACILHPLEIPKDSLAFLCFLKVGWKANKERMRRSSSIAIVVQQVLPFLE